MPLARGHSEARDTHRSETGSAKARVLDSYREKTIVVVERTTRWQRPRRCDRRFAVSLARLHLKWEWSETRDGLSFLPALLPHPSFSSPPMRKRAINSPENHKDRKTIIRISWCWCTVLHLQTPNVHTTYRAKSSRATAGYLVRDTRYEICFTFNHPPPYYAKRSGSIMRIRLRLFRCLA